MIFNQILNVSIAASWLVLVLTALRPLLKKVPGAIRCGLWILVAVRLLCPSLPESPVSLLPTAQVVPQTYLSAEAMHDPYQTAKLDIVTNPIYPETVDVALNTSLERLRWNDLYFTLIWCFGMGVMTLYASISYGSLRLKTRVSVRLEGNVWLCDDIDSPFILGLIRPRICLPSDLSQEQRNHVVAHEKAHLRRRDHWWKPIGFALLTIHWFNPVMWMAYVLLCRDIELACDEKVIRDMDKTGVRAYSEALLSCSIRKMAITACPLAFGEVGVKERIRSMLRYKKPGFWIWVTAAVVSVILIVCFLTNPAPVTIGNFREAEFEHLFVDAETLTLRWGGESSWEINSPQMFIQRLRNLQIDPNEVSRSLSPERDRTYEVLQGDTVLCISQDFSRIWVDNSVKPTYTYAVKDPDALRALIQMYLISVPGDEPLSEPLCGTYVPYQCLFMQPLSSYYPWGGDSGAVYHLGENSFTTEYRNGGVYVYDPLESPWQGIDWTSDFFRELLVYENILDSPPLSEFVSKDARCRKLSEDDFLLWENNTLILVNTADTKGTGRTIWSAYLLVPQVQMGQAQWEFHPTYSSRLPAFGFAFDMEYTHVSASTTEGTLISFDEPSQVGYPSGSHVDFPAGTALYWAPTSESGIVSSGARVHFTVFNGEEAVAQGTLYITCSTSAQGTHSQGQQDTAYRVWVYTAELIGTGLHLTQNLESFGGIIETME